MEEASTVSVSPDVEFTQGVLAGVGGFMLMFLAFAPSPVMFAVAVASGIVVLWTGLKFGIWRPALKYGLIGSGTAIPVLIFYALTSYIFLGPP